MFTSRKMKFPQLFIVHYFKNFLIKIIHIFKYLHTPSLQFLLLSKKNNMDEPVGAISLLGGASGCSVTSNKRSFLQIFFVPLPVIWYSTPWNWLLCSSMSSSTTCNTHSRGGKLVCHCTVGTRCLWENHHTMIRNSFLIWFMEAVVGLSSVDMMFPILEATPPSQPAERPERGQPWPLKGHLVPGLWSEHEVAMNLNSLLNGFWYTSVRISVSIYLEVEMLGQRI